MSNLSKIIAKIKALRARAADAASSEAEAAKAAEVADKLLREHNINLSELDVRAEGVEKNVWGAGRRIKSAVNYAAKNIAHATNTEVWSQNGGELAILGNPADVEVALYYLDLVSNAADACFGKFCKTDEFRTQRFGYGYSTRKIGSDYRIGVCQRLGERIRDQVLAEQKPQASGTGLVVVKNALIRDWLAEQGLRFKNNNRSRKVGSSYTSGRGDAESVGIGRGVGVRRTGMGLLA